MKRPRPDGLRSSEELDALAAIEDRLVESIGHEIEGWFIGRVLYRGYSDMFFYLPEPQPDDEDRLSSCVEAAAGDYEITQRIDEDPKWDFYTDFLWPDRASHQAMGNRRVLAQLETVSAHGVALNPDSVAAIGRAEARGNRWGVAALWIIALLLAISFLSGWS